jgi:hypothetical protein
MSFTLTKVRFMNKAHLLVHKEPVEHWIVRLLISKLNPMSAEGVMVGDSVQRASAECGSRSTQFIRPKSLLVLHVVCAVAKSCSRP